MTEKRTWFITGAGRGMGVEFAKAALGAGHALEAQIEAYEELSGSPAHEDATAGVS